MNETDELFQRLQQHAETDPAMRALRTMSTQMREIERGAALAALALGRAMAKNPLFPGRVSAEGQKSKSPPP